MIYHLLPELEPFSAVRGGAIAKDIANIMRFDSKRVVVCLCSDDTWGIEKERVFIPPLLSRYRKIPRRRFLPLSAHRLLLGRVLRPLLEKLTSADVVWCHNQPFFASALEKGIRNKNAKLIYHSHDGHADYAVRAALRSFRADAYIVVSDALRKQWLNLFPDWRNVYAIHNGADEEIFHPAPRQHAERRTTPVILFVGRLNPEKGVHVLLEAMRILEVRKIGAVCNIIGSAAVNSSRATRYVKRLLRNSPSNVRFLGHCSARKIGDQFREADIVCCPSIWQEPFGNVNIEAMACGIPVVASRVGGIPEISSEGGVLLVEPNSAVGLADSIQGLIENEVFRAKVAAEGLRSFRRRFTWAAIFKQYQEVTNSIS